MSRPASVPATTVVASPPCNGTHSTWLTAVEVADYLGVSIRTIRAWCAEHTIPHVRLPGRVVRFDRNAIDTWARSRAVPVATGVRTRSRGGGQR